MGNACSLLRLVTHSMPPLISLSTTPSLHAKFQNPCRRCSASCDGLAPNSMGCYHSKPGAHLIITRMRLGVGTRKGPVRGTSSPGALILQQSHVRAEQCLDWSLLRLQLGERLTWPGSPGCQPPWAPCASQTSALCTGRLESLVCLGHSPWVAPGLRKACGPPYLGSCL